ncbi:MAG: hypothetical protein WEA56_01995 [Balneolaceae bacterium]
MSDTFSGKKLAPEGYVYNTYGKKLYLKQAVASVTTLRRYDKERPVALFCSIEHKEILQENSLSNVFDHIYLLPDENASIPGFKHYVYKFMPFEKNLYLDGDIVWCRHPDFLWKSFSPYPFTITGNQISDVFFGSSKGIGILNDILLFRRWRTLKRFNITYLSRVQSGMIYAADEEKTKEVCELAQLMLDKRHLTHFRSRKEESGRTEETCEWSLAMAMAKLKIQVYPWVFGYNSPQIDFIDSYTRYNEDFTEVRCLIYNDRLTYNLRGLRLKPLRKILTRLFSLIPGKGDHLYATPFCLHFGWYHQKEPFNKFSRKVWKTLTS